MKESNPNAAASHESKIHCIEVLVPKNSIATSCHNLHWTLSVYSLENHPVNRSLSFHNSEVFHFMVYDWKRTIKQLLEDHQVHYSIIQYFTPDTVFSGTQDLGLSDNEAGFFSSLNKLTDEPLRNDSSTGLEIVPGKTTQQKPNLILD
ncbi:MAG: hypothetical protein WD824_04535 [Cyclobacteriaceae bacterium]